MAQYKRRLIPIVDRRFQFKYTAIIVAVAAVVSTILGAFLWQSYSEMNEMIATLTNTDIAGALDSDDSRSVFQMVVVFLVGEVVVLGVTGLLITHKVCGPIFVLERHLSTLNDQRYPTLRPLRSGDEFHSCFETFGETVDMLKARDEAELPQLQALAEEAKAKGLADAHISALEAMIEARKKRTAPEA